MLLDSKAQIDTIGLRDITMWTVITLNDKMDCRKICHKIDKELLQKFRDQNMPLEGKILYLEIKEITATIEPEKLKITGS